MRKQIILFLIGFSCQFAYSQNLRATLVPTGGSNQLNEDLLERISQSGYNYIIFIPQLTLSDLDFRPSNPNFGDNFKADLRQAFLGADDKGLRLIPVIAVGAARWGGFWRGAIVNGPDYDIPVNVFSENPRFAAPVILDNDEMDGVNPIAPDGAFPQLVELVYDAFDEVKGNLSYDELEYIHLTGDEYYTTWNEQPYLDNTIDAPFLSLQLAHSNANYPSLAWQGELYSSRRTTQGGDVTNTPQISPSVECNIDTDLIRISRNSNTNIVKAEFSRDGGVSWSTIVSMNLNGSNMPVADSPMLVGVYTTGTVTNNYAYFTRSEINGGNMYVDADPEFWNYEPIGADHNGRAQYNTILENHPLPMVPGHLGSISNDDSFNFLYKQIYGDFEIVSRVPTIADARANDRAGIMVRQGTVPNIERHLLLGYENQEERDYLELAMGQGYTINQAVQSLIFYSISKRIKQIQYVASQKNMTSPKVIYWGDMFDPQMTNGRDPIKVRTNSGDMDVVTGHTPGLSNLTEPIDFNQSGFSVNTSAYWDPNNLKEHLIMAPWMYDRESPIYPSTQNFYDTEAAVNYFTNNGINFVFTTSLIDYLESDPRRLQCYDQIREYSRYSIGRTHFMGYIATAWEAYSNGGSVTNPFGTSIDYEPDMHEWHTIEVTRNIYNAIATIVPANYTPLLLN